MVPRTRSRLGGDLYRSPPSRLRTASGSGQLARVNECNRDFSAIIFNNHPFTARSQDCRWLPSVAIFVNWQSLCTSVGENTQQPERGKTHLPRRCVPLKKCRSSTTNAPRGLSQGGIQMIARLGGVLTTAKKEFPMITNALTVAQKLLVARRKEVLAVGLMVLSTLGMIHPANAQEVTYIIFDAPGSTATQPASINAKGAITGSYNDANYVLHCFRRPPDG